MINSHFSHICHTRWCFFFYLSLSPPSPSLSHTHIWISFLLSHSLQGGRFQSLARSDGARLWVDWSWRRQPVGVPARSTTFPGKNETEKKKKRWEKLVVWAQVSIPHRQTYSHTQTIINNVGAFVRWRTCTHTESEIVVECELFAPPGSISIEFPIIFISVLLLCLIASIFGGL